MQKLVKSMLQDILVQAGENSREDITFVRDFTFMILTGMSKLPFKIIVFNAEKNIKIN